MVSLNGMRIVVTSGRCTTEPATLLYFSPCVEVGLA